MDSGVYGTYRAWPRMTTMYDNHSFEHSDPDKADSIMMYTLGHEHTADPYGTYSQPLDHPARHGETHHHHQSHHHHHPHKHHHHQDHHSKAETEAGSGGSDVDDSQKSQNRKQSCRVLMAAFLALALLGVIVAAVILAILLTKTPSTGQASFDEGFKSMVALENASYSSALADSETPAFKALEAEFCSEILKLLKEPDSPVKDDAFECNVDEFRSTSPSA